ncbi:MAG: hypothetical protein ACJ8GW_05100 [Massilia sp.]
MTSLWWFALPILLLPVWWHRQRRQRSNAQPLASARFLPATKPLQQRIWRWMDRVLLLVRLLLLATVIAWLADVLFPWHRDAVLIVPGTDPAWIEQQVADTGFAKAERISLPSSDAFGWFASHEREWRPEARILIVGGATMPALMPHSAHAITVRSKVQRYPKTEHHIAVVSQRAARWKALFAALDGPQRYIIDPEPGPGDELIVWDVPQAPPANLHAPLWWVGDLTAFPELRDAPVVDDVRYADSQRGRLWSSRMWPAENAEVARAQFESWQRLHFAPLPYTVPTQTIAPTAGASTLAESGALHGFLAFALLALFALERILAHASRR